MDIIIDKICKSYEDKIVLNDFSCTIEEGKITAFMGKSGCGKTTLVSIIAGIETYDSGKISGTENKKLSIVFQENRLCENLSPVSNVKLVCNSSIQKKDIINSLCNVGLNDCISQPVRELSGGMKRRVALIRALMAEYDILILDEPFKGLDDTTRQIVMDYLILQTTGKTVILVTHDIEEAKALDANIINIQ